MTDLRTLREEETLLLRVIGLSKDIKIVDGEGKVTDFTLDTSSHGERLSVVRAEIKKELAEKRRLDALDRDWYFNH